LFSMASMSALMDATVTNCGLFGLGFSFTMQLLR
jgi:hypothetical protein